MQWFGEHVTLLWTLFVAAQIVVVAFAVLFEKRHPAATMAWLLALIFLPYVGIVLYILIGRRKLRRTQRLGRIGRQLAASITEQPAARPIVPLDGDVGGFSNSQRRLMRLTRQLTGACATTGNAVRLFDSAATTYAALFDAIRGARHTVLALYYIVQPDETGRAFVATLAEAVRRGVVVRLLVDGIGSFGLDDELLLPLHEAAAEVAQRGRPKGFEAGVYAAPRFLLVRSPVWLSRMNYRNHRKIVIVDGRVGFTGGINIGDEYLGGERGPAGWRDTHVAIAGPAVADLVTTFLEDWLVATGNLFDVSGALAAPAGRNSGSPATVPGDGATLTGGSAHGATVQIIASAPDTAWHSIHLLYFQAIADARKRAWLTTPYFVPDESVLTALLAAALRGVDVRLLLPGRSDMPLVNLAAHSSYEDLLSAGVRIFEYKPGFLHAKTMVIDSAVATVGSANVDMRSFQLNYELNAFFYGPEVARQLEAAFERDVAQADEITLKQFRRRSGTRRLGEAVARLFSPLL